MAHEHSLEEVYRHVINEFEENVVRWCRGCGAVVVDLDFDGRTKPGGIVSMQFPKILKDIIEANRKTG